MMKHCKKCGELKPLNEFSKHPRERDGLRVDCKACNSIANAKWSAANREIARARAAAWSAANPEKKKATDAKWYAENQERHRAYGVKWRAENPDAGRVISQNRRARKREAGGKLSIGLADRLFKLQRGKCACCGLPLGDDYHLDHIMPLALGGLNTDDNMQLLTKQCNLYKHAKHPVDFMQQRGFLL